ncbi:Peptide methionine sulfoxide reductase, partial [Frankliniella fusca]
PRLARWCSRPTMSPLHDVTVPTEKATFCMGCYWAPECTFGVLAGVIRTRVGHAGAEETAPREECHEAIEMDFDPSVISYQQLLEVFWLHHDPTVEVPCEYASAILYHSPSQKELAERSVAAQPRPVLTKVLPAKVFHEAEE